MNGEVWRAWVDLWKDVYPLLLEKYAPRYKGNPIESSPEYCSVSNAMWGLKHARGKWTREQVAALHDVLVFILTPFGNN